MRVASASNRPRLYHYVPFQVNTMPHSTHEANGTPNGFVENNSIAKEHYSELTIYSVGHVAGNVSAQTNGTRSSQTTMLDRWANETTRDELPLNEVMQQPDAEYVLFSPLLILSNSCAEQRL